jgi:hypothetical protein
MAGKWVTFTAVMCILAATGAIGQAGSASGPAGTEFKVIGIVPTRKNALASAEGQPSSSPSGGTPSDAIKYMGGPVMRDGATAYYIWYGNWSKDAEAQRLLTDFITHLGGSAYFNINSTYYDVDKEGEKHSIKNRIEYGGDTTDHYSHGSSLSDRDVGDIVANAVSSGKLRLDPKGVYLVLTSADVNEVSGLCSGYCGFHGYQPMPLEKVDKLIAGFVGNPDRCPALCEGEELSPPPEVQKLLKLKPQKDVAAKGMVSVIAHELSESVTDPFGDGWISDGAENGDLCAFKYGELRYEGIVSPTLYNQTFGKRRYLSQQIWVNAKGGYCASSWSEELAAAFSVDVLSVKKSYYVSVDSGVDTLASVDLEVHANGQRYSLHCGYPSFHKKPCGVLEKGEGYIGWMDGDRMLIRGRINEPHDFVPFGFDPSLEVLSPTGNGKDVTVSFKIVGSSPVGASSEASTQTLQDTSGSVAAAASQEQGTREKPHDVTGAAREHNEQEAASELDLDPEVFYRLDAGKLVRLESQKLEAHITKWTGKVWTGVPGEKSPVRFRAGEGLEFIYRSKMASPPFFSLFSLRRLEAKKGKRELDIDASQTIDLTQYSLPVDFSRYGKESVKLTTQALTPGEYALRSEYAHGENAQTVFCFGVD